MQSHGKTRERVALVAFHLRTTVGQILGIDTGKVLCLRVGQNVTRFKIGGRIPAGNAVGNRISKNLSGRLVRALRNISCTATLDGKHELPECRRR